MPERPPDPDMETSTNTVMVWGLAIMAVLVILFPVYRYLEPRMRADANRQQTQELQAAGEELFSANCVACHAADGSGGIGPALNSRGFFAEASDEQIQSIISTGVPGSQMGAYLQEHGGPLTLEEIHALTAFIRTWEETALDIPNWRNPLEAVTATSAPAGGGGEIDGKAIFSENCVACHSEDLSGGIGKPLNAGSAAADKPDDELVQIISDGVSGTAMPQWSGRLSEAEIQAVLDYIRTVQNG